MNYYILLISISILGMVYFGSCTIIQLVTNTITNLYNSKVIYDQRRDRKITIDNRQMWFTLMFALFVALYNYLILTQL